MNECLLSLCYTVFEVWCDWMVKLYAKWLNYHSALTPLLGLCLKKKKKSKLFTSSRFLSLDLFPDIAVRQHLSFLFKPLILVCCGYFLSFTFTWIGNHVVKIGMHLKGLKIIQLLDCRRWHLWRIAEWGEVFLWFFQSANTNTQIQPKGADRVDIGLKNSAVFQSGSRHYASTGDTSSQTNYT